MDIVFVPGLNCTSRLFAPQIAQLGRSASCSVADHSVADSMEAIAADILAKAPPRFALIGLSMGGYVAYEMFRQQPERILGIGLLDTRASPDTPEDSDRRRQTIALAEGGKFDLIHQTLWQRLVHQDRLVDRELERVVTGMMQDTGAERFVRQQTALIGRRDYRPVLPLIRVPATVLVGAQDLITPPAMARELHVGIHGSRYVEIADCGHLSSLEKPDQVTRAIVDLLDEVRRAGV